MPSRHRRWRCSIASQARDSTDRARRVSASLRVAMQRLLNSQRQARIAAPHVGMADRRRDPRRARKGYHRARDRIQSRDQRRRRARRHADHGSVKFHRSRAARRRSTLRCRFHHHRRKTPRVKYRGPQRTAHFRPPRVHWRDRASARRALSATFEPAHEAPGPARASALLFTSGPAPRR